MKHLDEAHSIEVLKNTLKMYHVTDFNLAVAPKDRGLIKRGYPHACRQEMEFETSVKQ
jgi:hypothetical protein